MRIIDTYDLSREVIASHHFIAPSVRDEYRKLSARLGLAFPHSIALLDRLPIFMHGEAHKQMRAAMARRYAHFRERQLEAVDRFLARFEAKRIGRGGPCDLRADFAEPLFQAMNAATFADKAAKSEIARLTATFPMMFVTTTPLKRRLEIEAMVARLVETEGEDGLIGLALMLLGFYPLTGSLALSLHAIFSQYDGAELGSIEWPARFPRSSVVFIDRVCVHAVERQGASFAPGERLRCLAHSGEWSQADNHAMTFGAGIHLCLGRSLSETIWDKVVAMFSGHRTRVRARPLVLQYGVEPFMLAKRAPVEFF